MKTRLTIEEMPSQSADTKKLIDVEPVRTDLIVSAKGLIDATLAATKTSISPRFIHMCGIPGAGKTTYTDMFLKQNQHFALVQFDSVMEQLPGYLEARNLFGPADAFIQFELPARIIGYHLLQALVDNRRDVFFDHSGLNRQHVELLKAASSRGYKVEMHYIECSLDEALERIDKREQSEGRHTPRQIVSERHALLQELLPVYKGLVDKFVQIEPNICTPVGNKEECVE